MTDADDATARSGEWPAWPTFGLIDDVRPTLARAVERQEPVALVTLFHSEGGSPRGVGAQMVIGETLLAGHLSGGCIEGDVARHGGEVLREWSPRQLVYGRGGPWDLPLPCGGRIEALVEPVAPDDPALSYLLSGWRDREPRLWVTDGKVRSCTSDEIDCSRPEAWLQADQVHRRYSPALRLVLIGSDPIALAIAALAAAAEIEVILCRPNGPPEGPGLPGVSYRRSSLADDLREIGIDRWTAVAACTHDQDLDHEALSAALPSPAFYVGALGSERRLPERLDGLRTAGISEGDLKRLHSPIGLAIGARGPWEIAAAVLGDLIQAYRSSR